MTTPDNTMLPPQPTHGRVSLALFIVLSTTHVIPLNLGQHRFLRQPECGSVSPTHPVYRLLLDRVACICWFLM